VKNRYGPADEVGCFELRDDGIAGVPDPSGLFLNRKDVGVAGTAVTVVMEGKRPLLAEVQALVAKTGLPAPRRAVSDLDSARLAMILAVLERRGRVRLTDQDVFSAAVGGMRITEPAADLAIALAVASAAVDAALPADVVAVGEVGLAGLHPGAGAAGLGPAAAGDPGAGGARPGCGVAGALRRGQEVSSGVVFPG
jgi:DNA repair protein RadA/Sms